MSLNILNLPGLDVTDHKELEQEYHVKAVPAAYSKMCPHCGQSHGTVASRYRSRPALGRAGLSRRRLAMVTAQSFTRLPSSVVR